MFPVSQDTGTGLRAVDRIARQLKLEGVYGPLYRLFEITDSRFNMAVELTAGNRCVLRYAALRILVITYVRHSLFHVVVDNDETASKVLEVMLKEKSGRVTFMPLNRLKPKNPPLPDADDCEPLIDKLRFDPAYTKAF